MDRHQAIALLRELVEQGLAQPTAVYLRENQGKYELIMKDDCTLSLMHFIDAKCLG